MHTKHKRRLLKLAGLLEADAKNKKGVKFDLDYWAKIPKLDGYDIPETVPLNCGTTACAIGLACVSDAFKRSGFTYETEAHASNGNNLIPTYDGDEGFDAVERFFGLNYDEAEFLFVSVHYPDGYSSGAKGERAVAKRIRDFVDGRVKVPTSDAEEA